MTRSEAKLGARNPMYGKRAWNWKPDADRYPSGAVRTRAEGVSPHGSPEHRAKLSRVHKGAKKPWVSLSNKAKPRLLGKTRPYHEGSGNPVWAGGKDKYWARRARERDDYTCQECGLRDLEIMEVDHKIPKSIAPELRYELSNLITLCPNDHRRKTQREKKAINRAKREHEIPTTEFHTSRGVFQSEPGAMGQNF